MAELERDLRALGAQLELPPEPDLTAGVRARLGEPARRRPRRLAVVALAVVALAAGAAFAVPQSRGAILRWLGLRGVRIEYVDRLPKVAPRESLELGRKVSPAEARRLAGFRIVTSPLLGQPDEIFFDGRQVWFLYGRADGVHLLVSEFEGREQPEIVKKLVAPPTRVEFTEVGGQPGYWLSGAPHFLYIAPTGEIREERVRLAFDTLIWQRGPLTLRLEGDLPKDQAVRIAESFR